MRLVCNLTSQHRLPHQRLQRRGGALLWSGKMFRAAQLLWVWIEERGEDNEDLERNTGGEEEVKAEGRRRTARGEEAIKLMRGGQRWGDEEVRKWKSEGSREHNLVKWFMSVTSIMSLNWKKNITRVTDNQTLHQILQLLQNSWH